MGGSKGENERGYMKVLTKKRCVIGESPIWNEREEKLYFTNGYKKELCIYDLQTEQLTVRQTPVGISSVAFDRQNRLIVAHTGGVFFLDEKDGLTAIYDGEKYKIHHATDMKVGPDGAIYVGTVSEKFCGISEKTDGRLYRISVGGEVQILLDGLILSNGLEWSMDESKFYHADTGTHTIKEYFFDKETGKIVFSGRQVRVDGVDGLTIGKDNCLYVSGAWTRKIAVIDCETFTVKSHISPPSTFPMSCGFCGKDMDKLAVTTASDTADIQQDKNAGFTVIYPMQTTGRPPYLYGV